MLQAPDTSQDSENDKHHRAVAPAEEGWYLPRDLSKNRRHSFRGAIPKACEDTATTRLRNRLIEWDLIEERKGQRKDNKGRLLQEPPIFIRLRKDPEGIRKIDGIVQAAQALHSIKPLPGLSRQDFSQSNPRKLAVFKEWLNPAIAREDKYEAAKESLYIRYRHHMLRARIIEVDEFRERLDREITKYSGQPSRLQTLAMEEYLALQQQQNPTKEHREKRGGIQLSKKSPPDRTDSEKVESPPEFIRFHSLTGEAAFKLDALDGG